MKQYLYDLATGQRKGLFPLAIGFFLWALSLVYGFIVRICIFAKRRKPRRTGCKVISIGNITVGGTGKTALVEFIAACLKDHGKKVAILTRGYKKKVTRSQGHKDTSYEEMGDEPYMLKMRLREVPVIVDADRTRGAERAKNVFNADTVLLDDGFQQWGIAKDLEIVTIDAQNPFGNKRLLPAGLLREPLSSLARADIFVLTKTNLVKDTALIKKELAKFNPRASVFESSHEPMGFYDISEPDKSLALDSLKGVNAALFSGIGDPGSFEKLAASLGIRAGLTYRFSDHHDYTQQEFEKIFRESRDRQINTLITTEKDAVRLIPRQIKFQGIILALRIRCKLKDEHGFCHRLLGLYPV